MRDIILRTSIINGGDVDAIALVWLRYRRRRDELDGSVLADAAGWQGAQEVWGQISDIVRIQGKFRIQLDPTRSSEFP